MTALIHPNTVLEPAPQTTFDLENCEDFIGLSQQLMDGHHAGVLTTVNEYGRPHTRWMGTLSFCDFPRFYALTSPQGAKVAHIQCHPYVEWMFSNQDLTLVLNLSGSARILSDAASVKKAWSAMEDKSHAFFLQSYNEKPGFAVVETVVDCVECTLPMANRKWRASVDSFRKCLIKPASSDDAARLSPAALQVDEVLCQQVELLASGAEIHESRNLLGAYRAAVTGLQRGDESMRGAAHSAARALRRFLTRLRLAHYSRLRVE